jgi:hypothetical protein
MAVSFISNTYTGFTVSDTLAESFLDLGALFYNEEKEIAFRLGNSSSSEADYQILASGLNTEIVDAVTFSTDKSTYSELIVVSGIQPNGLSDILYCKLTCPSNVASGECTFLIHVDEV